MAKSGSAWFPFLRYLFLAGGGALLIFTLFVVRDPARLLLHGVEAAGTVDDTVVQRPPRRTAGGRRVRREATRTVYIRFMTPDGSVYRFTRHYGGLLGQYADGQPVTVLYLPDNPHVALVRSLADMVLPWLFVPGALLLMAVGFLSRSVEIAEDRRLAQSAAAGAAEPAAPGGAPVPNWLDVPDLYLRPRDLSRPRPRLIQREDVEALVLPAPRPVPRSIAASLNGAASPGVMAGFGIATLVFLAPALLVLLGVVDGDALDGVARVAPPLLALLSGLVVVFLAVKWWRNRRLLRFGQVVQGVINDVINTNWEVAIHRHRRLKPDVRKDLYKAAFSFDGGEGRRSVYFALWGRDGEIAERYFREGQPVTLLVDPSAPDHVLWLEVLRDMPYGQDLSLS